MIIYIGNFIEPSQEFFMNSIANAKRVISIDSFQRMFLAGIEQSGNKFDYIFNVPDIGSFPKFCKKIFIPGGNFNYSGCNGKNIPFLNIPYFKKYSIIHDLRNSLVRFLNGVDHNERILIVVSTLYYHLVKPVLDVQSFFPNIRICSIVYDLPDMLGEHQSLISKVLFKMLGKANIEYEFVKRISAFVVLSPYMMEKLDSTCPFIVMEGIYNEKLVEDNGIVKSPKTILYTGTLDSRYGTNELIDAFKMIPDPDFKLWICGDGVGRDYIEQASKIDSRIKYFGIVDQNTAFKMQKQAAILVNPRKASREYTKYSFPSKTMEYMASGTPTMMYKLPALPEDYCRHLILLPDESLETFSKYLYEWGSKGISELDVLARGARDFILKNKTSKVQASRFFAFLGNLLKEDIWME